MSSTAVSTISPESRTIEIPGVTNVGLTDVRKEWDRSTVTERLDEIVNAVNALTKAGEPIMPASAKFIVNAKDYSNLVGKHDGAMWASDTALYERVTGTANKGYGTRLLRLGRAMARYGVRAGSTDAQFIMRHGDLAFFTPVLGTSPDKAPAKDEYTKMMSEARRLYALVGNSGTFPSAAKVKELTTGSTGNDGKPNDGTDGTDDKGDKGTDKASTKPEGPVTKGDWQALVRGIESALKRCDESLVGDVHAMLVNVVSSDVKRRKVLADKARVNGATPKAPRKPRTPKVQAEATPEVQPEPEATPEVQPEPEQGTGE